MNPHLLVFTKNELMLIQSKIKSGLSRKDAILLQEIIARLINKLKEVT